MQVSNVLETKFVEINNVLAKFVEKLLSVFLTTHFISNNLFYKYT